MEFVHIPVLLKETIEMLDVNPTGIYVDGTVGGAGHSIEIAKKLTSGRLICLDRDPQAVNVAKERLFNYNATVVKANFSEMDMVLKDLGVTEVDGILMDIGVSSHQLDVGSRGFSYHVDAPLDMRMSSDGLTASDIVNTYSDKQIAKILTDFAEEKFAWRIATNIVKARMTEPIETTLQLAEIIKSSVPQAVRREKNPCKKTFQAIRIAVNKELEHLDYGLDVAFSMLKINGRLAVITFHSLEDRLVKQRFVSYCKGCVCPPDFPQCICGKLPRGQLCFKKPIEVGLDELELNNRSRSAKLRAVKCIRK